MTSVLKRIRQLEADGYGVVVRHYRRAHSGGYGGYYSVGAIRRRNLQICGKGGMTEVEIYSGTDDKVLARGVAIARDDENFSRSRGVAIALGRAVCELSGEAQRRRERDERVRLDRRAERARRKEVSNRG